MMRSGESRQVKYAVMVRSSTSSPTKTEWKQVGGLFSSHQAAADWAARVRTGDDIRIVSVS